MNGIPENQMLEDAQNASLSILIEKETTDKDKKKEYDRLRYKANKDAMQSQNKTYYETNRNKVLLRQKAHNKTNKEKLYAYAKTYRRANKEKIKQYHETHKKERNKKLRKRRKIDIKLRLNNNISAGIRQSLNGNKNGHHWEDLVGWTLKQLKKHLERQFAEDMSWENYGLKGWTIDHKIPVSVFNFTKIEHKDFKRCWALKNLQPLWALENISKNAKLDKPFQPSLLL